MSHLQLGQRGLDRPVAQHHRHPALHGYVCICVDSPKHTNPGQHFSSEERAAGTGAGHAFKGSDHCLSLCFPAFPCGSTVLWRPSQKGSAFVDPTCSAARIAESISCPAFIPSEAI
eukprot:SAG22_NODE_1584_length_4060_cov_81.610452_2_plen_116_part_00